MIEVPRAALTADEIAETAEFFSFGTNDLTQMTFGFSRDDAGKLPARLPRSRTSCRSDPFQSLDIDGRRRSSSRWPSRRAAPTQARPQVRHLRRARRRPGVDRVLPQSRAGLRHLLAVPRPDRPARRGAGGAVRRRRPHRLTAGRPEGAMSPRPRGRHAGPALAIRFLAIRSAWHRQPAYQGARYPRDEREGPACRTTSRPRSPSTRTTSPAGPRRWSRSRRTALEKWRGRRQAGRQVGAGHRRRESRHRPRRRHRLRQGVPMW